MSTQRYISTSFWDDKWIRSLDPSERYLYMYLLTNTLTTISGIYRITLDRIAYDTGYDERTLAPMLDRFQKAGKASHFEGEYMILPSWPKHQRWEQKETIKKGIILDLKTIPERVRNYAATIGYLYPIHTVPIGPELLYPDSDTDIDTDIDTHSEAEKPAPAPVPPNFLKTVYDAWMACPALPRLQDFLGFSISEQARRAMSAWQGNHSDDVLAAVRNYGEIAAHPRDYWPKGRPGMAGFFEGELFLKCLPANFPASCYTEDKIKAMKWDAGIAKAKRDAEEAGAVE